MKILLVNDYATPTGGAELMSLDLRAGLQERGHDVRLFASAARPDAGSSLADYTCRGTTSRFRTLLQTANLWAWRSLGQMLAEFRPDVVHVRIFLTQLSPLILPLLRHVPSIYHVVWYRPVCSLGTKMLPNGSSCQVRYGAACYHNGCLPLRDWLPLMLQMGLWRRWWTTFDQVVTISEALKRHLIGEGIAPVEVIPNGVPFRPQRPPLAAPPTVAFAGRLVREKGADLLLGAFARVVAQLPDAELLLVGDGPEWANLQDLVAQLDLRTQVTMPGYLPRPEMERIFSGAWVQAVPSRWAEPFGLVAAEGLMRGTAVVASDRGGLSEIVQDGQTGFLVPPDDELALAEALLRLLRDRSLAEDMGRAGREVALSRFSEDIWLDRQIQLSKELLLTGLTRWVEPPRLTIE
jgi:glycosyltransferase involved in cell wall biosynthesis